MKLVRVIIVLMICPSIKSMDKVEDIPFSKTVGLGPFSEVRDMFICPSRLAYRKQVDGPIEEEAKGRDFFCDEANMRNNNIIVSENEHAWLILNKAPYTKRGFHLLWIPKRHFEDYGALSTEEEKDMLSTFLLLDRNFNSESHQIRFDLNKGKSSGQSVPHFHWHIIIRTIGPKPLFEEAAAYVPDQPDPFVTKKLLLQMLSLKLPSLSTDRGLQVPLCRLCWYAHLKAKEDKEKLVVYRNDNCIVVMPPSSEYSGQLAVVPIQHCESLSNMQESTVLSMLTLMKHLSTIVCKAAHENIRSCSGLNTEFISYGQKEKRSPEYTHFFCLLTPRMPTKNAACIDINGGGYHPFDVSKYCDDVHNELATII